ncbi:MAG TPA: hypothetical protein HA354_06985, partial [Candidatus Poseidoniaceae archaeon]
MTDNLLSDLLAIQSTVRDYFGWSYEADMTSANEMSQLMSSTHPYGVSTWSPENRVNSMNLLKKRLQSAEKVVIVGASVEKSEVANLGAEDSVIIAA